MSTTVATPSAPRTLSMYWIAALLGGLVLLVGGVAHRALDARINAALSEVVSPRAPLGSLPKQFGPWHGDDIALDPRVLEAAHFDDSYVNRVYIDSRSRVSVGLFLGYVGRPRARMGHRPDVCHAAHGWEQVGQRNVRVALPDGTAMPAIVYEFQDPRELDRRLLVLAAYLINGNFTHDAADFGRWNARTPNLTPTERPAYLARIQLAIAGSGTRSVDQTRLEDLLQRVALPITEMMPYWNKPAAEPADEA